VTVERTVLSALGGGCQLPVGAYAEVQRWEFRLVAAVVGPDGSAAVRVERFGPRGDGKALGQAAATELLDRGARELLSRCCP
jgi:hydroxymethylbilane synthase